MGQLNFNEFIEAVQSKLSYPPNVQEDSWQFHIGEAVAVYSRHRPRIIVEDVVGSGAFDYDVPASFVDDFSAVVSIEYPYESTRQVPAMLKEGLDYALYRDPAGVRIRFFSLSPETGKTIRITYTVPHSLTISSNTIPTVDERAVVNLSAALLADQLASEFMKKASSTLPDATLDLRTKAQEYQTQADRYYNIWRREMGINDGEVEAATSWVDFDWRHGSGYPSLTHPRRTAQ